MNMERLTWEYKDGGMFVDEKEVKTYECDDILMHTGNAIIKLAEYEDAEEQGLLLKLPCKVGETVYTIGENNSPCEKCSHGKEVNYDVSNCLLTHRDYVCPTPEYFIESHTVEGFEISSGGIEMVEEWGYDCKHIFEPYYLTREAAEAALKKAGE